VTALTLYGKAGCHLCEEARAAVEAVRSELPLELEEIDVSLDPALNARYGERIPVLAIDGEEVFELGVSEEALRAEVARRAPGAGR
jgi:glutaredoxin